MKTLVLAEKPSVGRDIARVLGCKLKGDGYIYSDDYIISWAVGHLVTLQEPEDYNPGLKKWRMGDLPILPTSMGLKALPKTAKQLNLLKKIMVSKEVGQIICATDSGREGELIFRYIYVWAKCDKPVKRLWISSLTDAAIKDGLAKMKDSAEYDNLYASARCRAEADWLVGMNATRAFTLKHNDLLPMGRVQTPTLALLVARHHEIEGFQPKDYWEIEATFQKENEEYQGIRINAEGEDRVHSKEEAEAIAAKVQGKPGIVTKLETEEKRNLPPQLFDLTELQRECNRKLGFSAQKTLTTAQSLYEKHKLITYPRTDSRYLSRDIEPKLTPTLQSITAEPYNAFAQQLLQLPKLPTGSRIINDAKVTDHHAIIPTGKQPTGALTADEKAVYDRILRNFIAAFLPPHIYDVTTMITTIDEENFRTRGRMDKQPGWTLLYAHEKTKATDDNPIPLLLEGDEVTTTDVKTTHKKTQPPKPYTEATLLSAMENAGRFVDDEELKEALKSSGLGTPATRAAMIEKIISSGYVERKKKNLTPTEKGIRLISIVPPEMRQPETTGKWERGLTRIASGELDHNKFMASIHRYVEYLVKMAGSN
ncbi:MAG: DNA topoisomerase III [Defluviitaleaceae bacterium]|nr:DNA topoisomerase III [Defluviitaleaceae bacterium]